MSNPAIEGQKGSATQNSLNALQTNLPLGEVLILLNPLGDLGGDSHYLM